MADEQHSTHGWMIYAKTCSSAPTRHKGRGGKDEAHAAIYGGDDDGGDGTRDWLSTTAVDYKMPDTSGGVRTGPAKTHRSTVPVGEGKTAASDWIPTSRLQFSNPGPVTYERRKIASNRPSDPDHLVFGRLDCPKRMAELAGQAWRYKSHHADDFRAPGKGDFAVRRYGDPFEPSMPKGATY